MNEEHPLRTVSLRVLEDWAMMLVDPADATTAIFQIDEPIYMSRVKMHGVFTGTIAIVAQKEFLQSLASNLLGNGGNADRSDEELQDAFREMGNVLAGNFLTAAYGDDVVFDVLNPTVTEIAGAQLEGVTKSPQAYFFQCDDSPVCITFDVIE